MVTMRTQNSIVSPKALSSKAVILTKNYPISSRPNLVRNIFTREGALSMARHDENNPEMQSSATEFYIIQGSTYYAEDIPVQEKALGITLSPEQRKIYETVGGSMELDQKYTVFGEVVEGLDVVDKIASEKVYDLEKPLQKIPMNVSVNR